MKYVAPLDPDCPEVHAFETTLNEDPMTEAIGAPVDEIMESFTYRHRRQCARCREYGAININVE